MKTLLEDGNLLYWCIGKNDTLEPEKVLLHLKFPYNHVSGGLEVLPEHKKHFYYLVMRRLENGRIPILI